MRGMAAVSQSVCPSVAIAENIVLHKLRVTV